MAIRYEFKDRPVTLKGGGKADPQKIGEALAKIKQATNGRCNSKTILDAARDSKNYLHRFFEWRDSVAAEKYRQEQARELVACIDIVENEGRKNEKRLPAFVSLVDKGGRGYHTVQDVLDSAHLQDLALRQAENDLAAYEKRLAQFADICSAIRRARELISEQRRGSDEQRTSA
jgi:hypothetical protein